MLQEVYQNLSIIKHAFLSSWVAHLLKIALRYPDYRKVMRR